MKQRIITFALSFVLLLSLGVTAHAQEYNGVDFPDVHAVWTDKDAYPYAVMYCTDGYMASAQLYLLSHAPDNFGNTFVSFYDVTYQKFTWSSSNPNVWRLSEDGRTVSSESFFHTYIGFTSFDIYDANGALVKAANLASSQVCDGSTCPANDANADGICDDCGKMLRLTVSNYPELPQVTGNNLEACVVQRPDDFIYFVLSSDTPYSVSGVRGDKLLITVPHEQKVSYSTYKSTDGKNWVYTAGGTGYSFTVGDGDTAIIHQSTFDWYTEDGEDFFPGAPSPGGLQGLGTVVPTVMRLVKPVMIIAVSCLALLIGLRILPKVLRRFLG